MAYWKPGPHPLSSDEIALDLSSESYLVTKKFGKKDLYHDSRVGTLGTHQAKAPKSQVYCSKLHFLQEQIEIVQQKLKARLKQKDNADEWRQIDDIKTLIRLWRSHILNNEYEPSCLRYVYLLCLFRRHRKKRPNINHKRASLKWMPICYLDYFTKYSESFWTTQWT